VVATLESVPANATHWSRATMAERSGLSRSRIGRIWTTFDLKPHRTDGFTMSNDPLFVEKVYDVIGLYLNPRDARGCSSLLTYRVGFNSAPQQPLTVQTQVVV